MQHFDANQLIALMQAKSKPAHECLLSLFDIMDEQVTHKDEVFTAETIFNRNLTDFCILQAQKLNASQPTILAEHILLIAKNAFHQQNQQPNSQSLAHAKKAANALIIAQTHIEKKEQFLSKKAPYLAFATIVILSGFIYWPPNLQSPKVPKTIPETITTHQGNDTRAMTDHLSANEAAAMYAKFEMMRNGTCRYLEAIQIPDKDKAIYLESVVGGKLPTNLGDLAIANAYLEKIHCNYTPMLMKNSK
jgi:hypothetical protein